MIFVLLRAVALACRGQLVVASPVAPAPLGAEVEAGPSGPPERRCGHSRHATRPSSLAVSIAWVSFAQTGPTLGPNASTCRTSGTRRYHGGRESAVGCAAEPGKYVTVIVKHST